MLPPCAGTGAVAAQLCPARDGHPTFPVPLGGGTPAKEMLARSLALLGTTHTPPVRYRARPCLRSPLGVS